MTDKLDQTPDDRTPGQIAESLEYKLALVDKLADAMRDKFREKEPRRDWRDGSLSLAQALSWLLEEIGELVKAEPWEAMREAADVANLAAIYADLVERTTNIVIAEADFEQGEPPVYSNCHRRSHEIAPVMTRKCEDCHHEFGVAIMDPDDEDHYRFPSGVTRCCWASVPKLCLAHRRCDDCVSELMKRKSAEYHARRKADKQARIDAIPIGPS